MKPTVSDVLKLVREYYSKPGNGAGGSLHIVLDDGNLKDEDILFCREWAKKEKDEDGVVLADLILSLSKTQRRKLYYGPNRPQYEANKIS